MVNASDVHRGPLRGRDSGRADGTAITDMLAVLKNAGLAKAE